MEFLRRKRSVENEARKKRQRQLLQRLEARPQTHLVTYTLPSLRSSNSQTIPKDSTTKDLGIILNPRFSAEYYVFSVANKARRMLFYMKRSFAALTPSVFSSLTQFLSGHTLNMLFKHPIPSYTATQRHWKRCRTWL